MSRAKRETESPQAREGAVVAVPSRSRGISAYLRTGAWLRYSVWVLAAVYCLIMAFIVPGFASTQNAGNVLEAMLPLLIVAAGQTVVLMTAGIDLSVTSIIALTSVAGAAVMTGDDGLLAGHPASVPVGILCMLAFGAFLGFLNGGCVAWLRMPPFIVTLTSMMFLSGLAIWATQSKSIYNLPSSFMVIGKNTAVAAAVACVAAGLIQFILSRTWLGMGLKAVGGNPRTALVSGIPVQLVTISAYVISGLSAATASILITGQLETGSPVQWENNLLDVIGATVIGGTSLYGGRGSVWGTLGGVLLLSVIDNSLNLMSLSYFTIMMAKGGVILLAALIDTLQNRGGNR